MSGFDDIRDNAAGNITPPTEDDAPEVRREGWYHQTVNRRRNTRLSEEITNFQRSLHRVPDTDFRLSEPESSGSSQTASSRENAGERSELFDHDLFLRRNEFEGEVVDTFEDEFDQLENDNGDQVDEYQEAAPAEVGGGEAVGITGRLTGDEVAGSSGGDEAAGPSGTTSAGAVAGPSGAAGSEEVAGAAGGNQSAGTSGTSVADEGDLLTKIQRLFSEPRPICVPAVEQKATHISALPLEIIFYIFRWVVSNDLDLRSLEMCSMVCRGFYLCCRDPEIWRVACIKLWGRNCGTVSNMTNWRTMYLGRPRLNFNGCYISKSTYIRHGENSFQDQFYRPWHIVEYFRYLRFFPEGIVLMLTTADPPAPVLNILRRRESRNPSVLTGHYRLQDDSVTVILRRQDLLNSNRFIGMINNIPLDFVEQTFEIVLRVLTIKNRQNCQLVWRTYTVLSKHGTADTRTNFDVSSHKYPPFWFSRVRSYTAESEKPL